MTFFAQFPVPPPRHVVAFSEDGSLSEGRCSMRITEDVRRYGAENRMSDEDAIRRGMEGKSCRVRQNWRSLSESVMLTSTKMN